MMVVTPDNKGHSPLSLVALFGLELSELMVWDCEISGFGLMAIKRTEKPTLCSCQISQPLILFPALSFNVPYALLHSAAVIMERI
jgi:hypothetical protein